jgi:hypothetical protein
MEQLDIPAIFTPKQVITLLTAKGVIWVQQRTERDLRGIECLSFSPRVPKKKDKKK